MGNFKKFQIFQKSHIGNLKKYHVRISKIYNNRQKCQKVQKCQNSQKAQNCQNC